MEEDKDSVSNGFGNEEVDDAAAPIKSVSRNGTDCAASPQESGAVGRNVLSYPIEDFIPPSINSSHDLRHTFSWDSLLNQPGFVAAPVSAFKHAPLSDCWDNIVVGMKVEVRNVDINIHGSGFSEAFWLATVLRISGFKALLRYEGFGQDDSKDFWISLCSDQVHPVGWCTTKGKPLIPPRHIQTKYSDWKDFLVKRLTGARTLPCNFYHKVSASVESVFRRGMKLEVVDKMRICQVRVATICEIIGRRLFVQYDNVDHDDRGFWCHEESPLIHPVGWARRVGHLIVASQEYYDRCARKEYGLDDCTPDMFPEYRPPPGNFSVGMKLEAVDPLNLATICVATVMKVLRFGYIMIRIDGCENDATGSDWFCYHASSPLIFPPGFCERSNLIIKPPSGYDHSFSWYEYLKETQSTAAPASLFIQRVEVKHSFKVGMKVEAADQMDPRLICVSTISNVVGRLLKVHFDGWEDDYDQWMDCQSVDIYPVGWSELVGHKLEGPRVPIAPAKKEKKKSVGRKGKKRPSEANAGEKKVKRAASVVPMEAPPSPSPVPPAPDQKSCSAAASPITSSSASSQATSVPEASSSSPSASHALSLSSTTSPVAATVASATSMATASVASPPQPDVAAGVGSSPSCTTMDTQVRVIPRLVDSSGQAMAARGKDTSLDPSVWSVEEVAQFLQINECSSLVEAFTKQNVDGARFLSLLKGDVLMLVGNKIGPCLKIENLLRLLKTRMNPAQARFMATINRKS